MQERVGGSVSVGTQKKRKFDCDSVHVDASEEDMKWVIPNEGHASQCRSLKFESDRKWKKSIKNKDNVKTNEIHREHSERKIFCNKIEKNIEIFNKKNSGRHGKSNLIETDCVTDSVTERRNIATSEAGCTSNSLKYERERKDYLRQLLVKSSSNYPETLFPCPPIKMYNPLEGREKVVDFRNGRAVTLGECFNNYCSYLNEFAKKYLK